MKAGFISKHGGPEVVTVGTLPRKDPKPGEVRIRMSFAALNHLDLWVRSGWPALKLSFPHVLGSDGSGTVDAVGSQVKEWKAGDRVIVHPGLSCGVCEECKSGIESLCRHYHILGEHVSGTFAEEVVVPKENIFAIPQGISFEEAASITLTFTTAWEMLVNKARVKAGDFVLIHGAGSGVSVAAIQIAKAFGAEVFVTSGSQEKLEAARKLGSDHGCNYKVFDFVEEVRKHRKSGPDIIVDHVGEAFWKKNIAVLRSGGVLVTCGATSGPKGETDLRHVFFRQLRVLGSTMGSKRDLPKILDRFVSGEFKAVVSKIFPLQKLPEALDFLASGQQNGKVLVML